MPINTGLTSKSGTIASGGVAQTQVTHNLGRNYLLIQNLDTSEDMWISFASAAVVGGTGSIKMVPGMTFIWDGSGLIPTNAVSVIAATGGHKFTIYEG